ncbi:hypothetical protein AURDEDRAFT_177470 [Auricularia subglabra TFB-10046 SS5]|uniref:F-box domain-containing protein n=1 Tax=Auricularia subglabra (strain TFB-10046 / SS5) TaxID=717982 RepID=J0WNP3_AURST|nr:hypothetical protein AURDEDRAFT_177470 [Auricularia subglabra TFB-10046 SS5]
MKPGSSKIGITEPRATNALSLTLHQNTTCVGAPERRGSAECSSRSGVGAPIRSPEGDGRQQTFQEDSMQGSSAGMDIPETRISRNGQRKKADPGPLKWHRKPAQQRGLYFGSRVIVLYWDDGDESLLEPPGDIPVQGHDHLFVYNLPGQENHELLEIVLTRAFNAKSAKELITPRSVSRRWKRVVDGCPHLWSRLILRADDGVVSALPTLLARSGTVLLDISISIPLKAENVLPRICERFIPSMHRVRNLAIHGDGLSLFESLACLLGTAAPMLRSLDLSPCHPNYAQRYTDLTLRPLPGSFDPNLFANLAHHLGSLDLGNLSIPATRHLALSRVKTLFMTVDFSNKESLCGIFHQFPRLERLFLTGSTWWLPVMPLPKGHPFLSATISGSLSQPELPWQEIASCNLPHVCVMENQPHIYSTIVTALGNRNWEMRSLTVEYGGNVSATLYSGDLVRDLQTVDQLTFGADREWFRIISHHLCMSSIVDLSIGLSVDLGLRGQGGNPLPLLILPSLARLNLICGPRSFNGWQLPCSRSFIDDAVLSQRAIMQAPHLSCIRFISRTPLPTYLSWDEGEPRAFMHTHLDQSTLDLLSPQCTIIDPSSLARFIQRIELDGAPLPELRIDVPQVSLAGDAAAHHELAKLVSGIICTPSA